MRPQSKEEIRQLVWRRMERERAARFPGTRGRIPNFVGAERAALQLQALRIWKQARVIKVNPDAPQLPVRRMALREGKIVYMPVPRLREKACFLRLDPALLGAHLAQAASIKGADRFGRPVTLEELRPLDLIICGSVAVNVRGARVGKGGGYSDLEYALLTARGVVSSATPILTTIHSLQLLHEAIEMRVHDIPVDWVVTPEGATKLPIHYPRPKGIVWELLAAEKIAAVPVLKTLLGSR